MHGLADTSWHYGAGLPLLTCSWKSSVIRMYCGIIQYHCFDISWRVMYFPDNEKSINSSCLCVEGCPLIIITNGILSNVHHNVLPHGILCNMPIHPLSFTGKIFVS